jgi:hypothetical protein
MTTDIYPLPDRTSPPSSVMRAIRFALLALGPIAAYASSYDVSINTAGLSGSNVKLAFDLVGGDSSVANNVLTLTDFSTDGTLGVFGISSISDTAFFNELLRDVTFGSYLNFSFSVTENVAPPGFDQFSFFLLDSTGAAPLFDTTDPFTGVNSLFSLDITGVSGGALAVYNAVNSSVTWSVTPASTASVPDSGSMFFLGLCSLSGLSGLSRVIGFRQRLHRKD